jgi:pyruvate,orthophosphate dikinase
VIDLDKRQCRIGETVLQENDFLSLDGNAGSVHAGRFAVVTQRPELALAAIAGWRLAHI